MHASRDTIALVPSDRPGRKPDATRIAAIDVGSNSIRQIIADVSADGAIAVVDEIKAGPRLGAALERSGRLHVQSMERALDALGHMATLARKLDSDKVVAVATSAVRDAENAEEFLAEVKSATGLSLKILSGLDEARLSYLSALAHFELGESRTAVVDLGGGSLELALSLDGVVDRLLSLPLGAVRLTEAFLGKKESERKRSEERRVGKECRS